MPKIPALRCGKHFDRRETGTMLPPVQRLSFDSTGGISSPMPPVDASIRLRWPGCGAILVFEDPHRSQNTSLRDGRGAVTFIGGYDVCYGPAS
jgi:hypothetical protein